MNLLSLVTFTPNYNVDEYFGECIGPQFEGTDLFSAGDPLFFITFCIRKILSLQNFSFEKISELLLPLFRRNNSTTPESCSRVSQVELALDRITIILFVSADRELLLES